jgi:hypothetical protein
MERNPTDWRDGGFQQHATVVPRSESLLLGVGKLALIRKLILTPGLAGSPASSLYPPNDPVATIIQGLIRGVGLAPDPSRTKRDDRFPPDGVRCLIWATAGPWPSEGRGMATARILGIPCLLAPERSIRCARTMSAHRLQTACTNSLLNVSASSEKPRFTRRKENDTGADLKHSVA